MRNLDDHHTTRGLTIATAPLFFARVNVSSVVLLGKLGS